MGELLKGKLQRILGQRPWLPITFSLSKLAGGGVFPLSAVPASHRYRRGSWLMGMTG